MPRPRMPQPVWVAVPERRYWFVKTPDGRYLQASLDDAVTGRWRYWLDARRAWAPCSDSRAGAQAYADAARATVGALVLVEEAL